MKKAVIAVFAFAVMFAVGSHSAHAQVVQTEASSTPAAMGGYGTPCFYLRQTHEWEQGYVCNDAEQDPFKFAFDPLYRNSILVPFLNHIFVDVPAKQGRK